MSTQGETAYTLDNGTEIAVHRGAALQEGTVALQIHNAEGEGISVWLTPREAQELAAVLVHKAHG